MAVQMPQGLYQKLLIAPQFDVPKKVGFSDINPVKTFHYNDPPAALHDTLEVARLKAKIAQLEQGVARRDARIHELSVSHMELIGALVAPPRTTATPRVAAKPTLPVRKPTPPVRKPNKHAPFFRRLGTFCAVGFVASVVLTAFFPPAGIPLAVIFGLLSLTSFNAASE